MGLVVGQTTRLVTKVECPWLAFDVMQGTQIFAEENEAMTLYSRGIPGIKNILVSFHANLTPSQNFPVDAVFWFNGFV